MICFISVVPGITAKLWSLSDFENSALITKKHNSPGFLPTFASMFAIVDHGLCQYQFFITPPINIERPCRVLM